MQVGYDPLNSAQYSPGAIRPIHCIHHARSKAPQRRGNQQGDCVKDLDQAPIAFGVAKSQPVENNRGRNADHCGVDQRGEELAARSGKLCVLNHEKKHSDHNRDRWHHPQACAQRLLPHRLLYRPRLPAGAEG